MSSTVTSVKFYLARTSNRTGWNLYCDLHAATADGTSTNPSSGTLLGRSNAVSIDSVGVAGNPSWITFTFATPVTISSTGFYGIQLWGDTSDYQFGGLYVYVASDYDSNEVGWTSISGSWAQGGGDWAYEVVVSAGNTNSATTYTGSGTILTGKGGADYGCGVRSYIDAGSAGKASDPTPADGADPVDFDTPTLSWTNNAGVGATFDIRGGGAGNFTLLVEGTSDTTVTLDSTDKAAMICDDGADVRWRIDTHKDGELYIGDDWTFNPRPGAPTGPTPSDAGTNINLASTAFEWSAGGGSTDTYDVVVDGNTLSSAQAGTTYTLDADSLDWDTTYTWRVDAENYYGTTTGTEWTFTTIAWDGLQVSYELISGGSGNGPYDSTPGTFGVDYYWTGLNNVCTIKRLVVVARDRVYYETL